MKVEFHRPEDPETTVATATWNGRAVGVESGDDVLAVAVWKLFRATPVVVDDASYRSLGTHGDVLVHPGSLRWFRAAAQQRAREAGLVARIVPDVTEGGFDPAADYRTFDEAIERLTGTADP